MKIVNQKTGMQSFIQPVEAKHRYECATCNDKPMDTAADGGEAKCTACKAHTFEADSGHCIVGLQWSLDSPVATHATLVGIVAAPVPQGSFESCIASIGRKKLPEPKEEHEVFALEMCTGWLGGASIAMEHSQVYYTRGVELASHSNSDLYSPPTTGCIGRSQADVVKVVKVGLENCNAQFNAEHDVAYHGLPAHQMQQFDLAEAAPRFRLKPSADGAHGPGVYLTRSFRMASVYAYEDWEGGTRFAVGPSGQHFTVVAMCSVPKSCSRKCAGTAFADNHDGWESAEIELVVQPEHVHVYGLLFCFFNPDPMSDPRSLVVHPDTAITALVLSADGKLKLENDAWAVTEPSVPDYNPAAGDCILYVTRNADGTIKTCEFCAKHADVPNRGACMLATAFSKEGQADGGVLQLRILALPRVHIAGVASAQFWALKSKYRRMLLWELRHEGIRVAKDSACRINPGIADKLHVAMPVYRDGEWVYDLELVRAGAMLLLFHTFVSREHLHLHVAVAGEDGGADLIRGDSERWRAGGRYAELGLPGSYSVTWRQVYELCCDESMTRSAGGQAERTAAAATQGSKSCARDGCECTVAFRAHDVIAWQGVCPPLSPVQRGPMMGNDGFCCDECKDGGKHPPCLHI